MITKKIHNYCCVFFALVLGFGGLRGATAAQTPATISRTAQMQIQALLDEKATRTAAEQKLDSQLVYALKQQSGAWRAGLPPLEIVLRRDKSGRVLVDFKATVDSALLNLIAHNNGSVVSKSERFQFIRAWVPLESLRALAAPAGVRFISPAAEAELNRVDANPKQLQALKSQLMAYVANRSGGAQPNTGAVTSQGDVTHKADLARNGLVFTGMKIGILSDSIDDSSNSYANAIASGDVPVVTVLPGQEGTGSGEGLAMLEIVYDLCPGAQLYFASAFNGPGSFAQNIIDLRAAGCEVIADDVGYFNESPFFDDVISRAVSTVTASGALYFSSCANSGTKAKNSSGTWSGDFLDGGAVAAPLTSPASSRLHMFTDSVSAVQQTFTAFPSSGTTGSSRRGDLFWSDPDNGSSNDYDLFYLDNTGATIIASSTNLQTGTQDPYEQFSLPAAGPFIGRRFVVVKAEAAASRYLYLGSGRGYLTISTPGQTKGHSTAGAGFGVAATPTGAPSGGGNPAFPPTSGPFPNPFTTANKTEIFSSDGLRRYFYNPDGSPVTPGNLSSTGGAVRQKPDITAADGVVTTLPGGSGLNPFYGTSAAAPHAAAIAAIVKAKNPTLTVAQVRTALTTTAIDIETPGYDNVSGFGILDAQAAVNSITPAAGLSYLPEVRLLSPSGNGNLDRNVTNKLFLKMINASGSTAAANVTASITSPTTGVVLSTGTASYGTLEAGGSAENATPFLIRTLPSLDAEAPVEVTVNVSFDGAPPVTYHLSFEVNP